MIEAHQVISCNAIVNMYKERNRLGFSTIAPNDCDLAERLKPALRSDSFPNLPSSTQKLRLETVDWNRGTEVLYQDFAVYL